MKVKFIKPRVLNPAFIVIFTISFLGLVSYGFNHIQAFLISTFSTTMAFLLYYFIFSKRFFIKDFFHFFIGFSIGILFAYLIYLVVDILFFPLRNELFFVNALTFGIFPILFGILFVESLKKRSLISLFKEDKEDNISTKVIDTSTLIDYRIVDVLKTGFLEGKFIIPRFVLEELQFIADTHDPVARNKGRRGLEAVKELLKLSGEKKGIFIEIFERDIPYLRKTDEKLLELTRKFDAKLLSLDYNLIQLAHIKGIETLNLNDLINALKPNFVVGEDLSVSLVKKGKDKNQAIGYLNDGTMVIVDNAGDKVGKKVNIEVTNILQTSAGRIVFGKFKNFVNEDEREKIANSQESTSKKEG
ncbi:MAG TPA: TRAM domain-containing protein [Desulfurobacteriaceae bacterium]|nr:TRAM domain-containing protein [Desulfurobacteriaceae bacterium]